MLRLAARLRALAGALACALVIVAAMAHQARAEDNPARADLADAQPRAAPKPPRPRVAARAPRHPARSQGASLTGVYGPLAAKAREIVAACGSRVVSGVRRTRVAGTRRMSQHASGRAVDLRGNPACIYARLRGWRGGYSTDYATAPGGPHVHVSLGGREDGRRFAHRASRPRYAARGHRRI